MTLPSNLRSREPGISRAAFTVALLGIVALPVAVIGSLTDMEVMTRAASLVGLIGGASAMVCSITSRGESRRSVMAVTSLAMLIASSTLIGISFTG